MQNILGFVLSVALIAAVAGVVFPYKSLQRKQFGVAAALIFFCLLIVLPPITPPTTKKSEQHVGIKDAPLTHSDIVQKGEVAKSGTNNYIEADSPNTLKLVGRPLFARLAELEPGAIYVAAESEQCDAVTVGAVSQNNSSLNQPVWFVDCSNGNRFMVNLQQAEAGLARYKDGQLKPSQLAPSCTINTVSRCN